MNSRMRGAATVMRAGSMAALLALAGAGPAAGQVRAPDPTPEEKLVDGYVEQKAQGIRHKLQGEFEGVDRSRLLGMKENIDTFLGSVLLLEDAMDAPVWQWWMLPVNEFREGGEVNWWHEGPADDGRQGLSDANRPVRFSATMSWSAAGGEDYPVMIWTRGDIAPGVGDVNVRYYEPYLVNHSLGFPLHPERLIIRWSPQRLQVLDHGGARTLAEEYAGQRDAVFNNPDFTYAIFDTLRLKLREPNFMPGAARDDAPRGAPVGAWSVALADGRPVRCVELSPAEDGLSRLWIHQRPTRLVHESPIPYQIRRDYPDGRVATEVFVPTVEVEHLQGGREIEVDLRRSESGWLPARARVSCEESALFEAAYDVGGGQGDADLDLASRLELQDALARLDGLYLAIDHHKVGARLQAFTMEEIRSGSPHVRRARLKYNLFAASYGQNMESLVAWLAEYRRMLDGEGVPSRYYVYNVEALAQVGMDAIDPDWAAMVAGGPLRDAYRECGSADLADHAARLVLQFRVGMAVMALDELGSRSDTRASWARTLAGTLRRSWEKGELAPGAQYPYADQSAAMTQLMFSTVLPGASAPAGSLPEVLLTRAEEETAR